MCVCMFWEGEGESSLLQLQPETVEFTETEEGSAYTSECIYDDFVVI